MNEENIPHEDCDQTRRVSKEHQFLKAWTGKSNSTLVFDTDTDGWDHGKFNDVLRAPSNAVIGITDEGDVFGGYVSVAINETDKWLPDDGQFAFSFFSHGRCDVPQRWMMKKDREYAGEDVRIWPTGDNEFIRFGNSNSGCFSFNSQTNWSYIYNPSKWLNGLDDTVLTGKNKDWFTTTRLLVVRLE